MKNKVEYFNTKNLYKKDIFDKLNYSFKKGKNILDVGCGDGTDAEIFINKYHLKTWGSDVYEDRNVKNIKKLNFSKGSIYKLPYSSNYFDYVFLHDVLHHIDEDKQRYEKHISALKELKRITKKGGTIIIIEGNRFNPLFYPHMVKMKKHEHFRQKYFKTIISDVFENVKFKFFEAHVYPKKLIRVFKVYEFLMEHIAPKSMLAYNIAIIKNIYPI